MTEPIPTTTDKKTLTIEDMLPFNPSPAKLEHPQTPNQLEKKKSPNSGMYRLPPKLSWHPLTNLRQEAQQLYHSLEEVLP